MEIRLSGSALGASSFNGQTSSTSAELFNTFCSNAFEKDDVPKESEELTGSADGKKQNKKGHQRQKSTVAGDLSKSQEGTKLEERKVANPEIACQAGLQLIENYFWMSEVSPEEAKTFYNQLTEQGLKTRNIKCVDDCFDMLMLLRGECAFTLARHKQGKAGEMMGVADNCFRTVADSYQNQEEDALDEECQYAYLGSIRTGLFKANPSAPFREDPLFGGFTWAQVTFKESSITHIKGAAESRAEEIYYHPYAKPGLKAACALALAMSCMKQRGSRPAKLEDAKFFLSQAHDLTKKNKVYPFINIISAYYFSQIDVRNESPNKRLGYLLDYVLNEGIKYRPSMTLLFKDAFLTGAEWGVQCSKKDIQQQDGRPFNPLVFNKTAFDHYSRAAALGDSMARYHAGLLAYESLQAWNDAAPLFEALVNDPDVEEMYKDEACALLLRMYWDGKYQLPQDKEKAMSYADVLIQKRKTVKNEYFVLALRRKSQYYRERKAYAYAIEYIFAAYKEEIKADNKVRWAQGFDQVITEALSSSQNNSGLGAIDFYQKYRQFGDDLLSSLRPGFVGQPKVTREEGLRAVLGSLVAFSLEQKIQYYQQICTSQVLGAFNQHYTNEVLNPFRLQVLQEIVKRGKIDDADVVLANSFFDAISVDYDPENKMKAFEVILPYLFEYNWLKSQSSDEAMKALRKPLHLLENLVLEDTSPYQRRVDALKEALNGYEHIIEDRGLRKEWDQSKIGLTEQERLYKKAYANRELEKEKQYLKGIADAKKRIEDFKTRISKLVTDETEKKDGKGVKRLEMLTKLHNEVAEKVG